MANTSNKTTTVQISVDARQILEKLAIQDRRSATKELETIVYEKWEKRVSKPNTAISIEEAAARA